MPQARTGPSLLTPGCWSERLESDVLLALPRILSSIVNELPDLLVPLSIYNIHDAFNRILRSPCAILRLIVGTQVAGSKPWIIRENLHVLL
jgi:hypothetical protein